MKRRESIIVVIILVLVLAYYFIQPKKSSVQVVVYHHKKVLQTIDVSKNKTYTFKGDVGEFHLEVKDQKYRAIDVDCPNQICVHTGYVKLGEEKSIVCAPNGISVVQQTR